MCPCDPADLSGNVEVSHKLPYGSHQANALAVNLNGRDVNAVSSYYGTSPLPAAVVRNREVRGLGRLRGGNRDDPRSAEVLRTDPEIARQRQTLGTLSFTAHNDLASTPVDIVELELSATPRPLLETDERNHFDCERDSLNGWFRRHAWHNHVAGISRISVICDSGSGLIVGYVTLSAAQIEREFLAKPQRRNKPDPVPATLLGQLAVDKRYQRQGYARSLLHFALNGRTAAVILTI